MAEFAHRRVPFERIDHSNHGFDPREREPQYSVIVNRTSPSSHTRGHGAVLFYAEPLLSHYESLGVPVINPVAAWRVEKSKALQVELFERLGLDYPRTAVVNHPDQVLKSIDRFRFPVLLKPNVGGSGAGIVRFDAAATLEAALPTLAFGPDGVALLQEYVAPRHGAVVRVEILDGQCLYAIRIVREPEAGFNLCPADLCRQPEAGVAPGAAAACPADARISPGMTVTRVEAPPQMVDAARRLARAASIDVGGVEFLEGAEDGRIYVYDVNATSNFVANARDVLGFDPFPRLADFILSVATRGT